MSDNWKLVKYNSDVAIYARCKCGFQHCCSRTLTMREKEGIILRAVPSKFYKYCPFCGIEKEDCTLIHRIDQNIADLPFEDKEFYEKGYSLEEFFMDANYKDWFEPNTTH